MMPRFQQIMNKDASGSVLWVRKVAIVAGRVLPESVIHKDYYHLPTMQA
jgi:hypothetical protein